MSRPPNLTNHVGVVISNHDVSLKSNRFVPVFERWCSSFRNISMILVSNTIFVILECAVMIFKDTIVIFSHSNTTYIA